MAKKPEPQPTDPPLPLITDPPPPQPLPPVTDPPPPPPPPQAARRFKVRATQLGYFDHQRRRIGDVFWVTDQRNTLGQFIDFSPKWMARVPDDTPEQTTTGQQDLRRQHDEILAGKAAGALAASGESPSMRNPLDD